MREGMEMPEKMREQMGLPKDAEETVKMLKEAFEGQKGEQRKEILTEQIDNLLEAAFDEDSGLTAEQRNNLKEAAKGLQDELEAEERKWDDLKGQLAEMGWLGEEGHTVH